MNKRLLVICLAVVAGFTSCKKDEDDPPPTTPPVTTENILTDFASFVSNPIYLSVENKTIALYTAVQNLNTTQTEQNLTIARDAWRSVRTSWEQSESHLFGPAEDFNYDPATDSWPVNTTELDSLLASSNPLDLASIDLLEYTLKGYHPIEYVLFGVGGVKVAADITPREMQYLTSLTQSLVNTNTQLRMAWDPTQPGNFTEQLVTAGTGSVRFATRKDALITMVGSMAHICNEVASGKMEDPLAALDSGLVESQYAHNATIDFKNNIIGVQNVYLCRFTSTGRSMHDYVAAREASLDNDIRAKINAAIDALDAIDPNYGLAIWTQVNQIHTAQSAITDLEASLNQLENFFQANVTD